MTWFEDMKIGARVDVGTVLFEEDAMITFSKTYDPRAYLIDKASAAEGPFGKLVASPWHITAAWMGLMIKNRTDNLYSSLSTPSADGDKAMIGPSPGFVDLSWANPVEAGDTIAYSMEVSKLITLKSKPQWGICRNLSVGVNQRGEEVLRFFGQVLMERKPTA